MSREDDIVVARCSEESSFGGEGSSSAVIAWLGTDMGNVEWLDPQRGAAWPILAGKSARGAIFVRRQ